MQIFYMFLILIFPIFALKGEISNGTNKYENRHKHSVWKKLVRKLHGQNSMQPETNGKLYTVDEAYKMMMDLVDRHYDKE